MDCARGVRTRELFPVNKSFFVCARGRGAKGGNKGRSILLLYRLRTTCLWYDTTATMFTYCTNAYYRMMFEAFFLHQILYSVGIPGTLLCFLVRSRGTSHGVPRAPVRSSWAATGSHRGILRHPVGLPIRPRWIPRDHTDLTCSRGTPQGPMCSLVFPSGNHGSSRGSPMGSHDIYRDRLRTHY